MVILGCQVSDRIANNLLKKTNWFIETLASLMIQLLIPKENGFLTETYIYSQINLRYFSPENITYCLFILLSQLGIETSTDHPSAGEAFSKLTGCVKFLFSNEVGSCSCMNCE